MREYYWEMTYTTRYSVKSRINHSRKKQRIFQGKNRILYRSLGMLLFRLSISFFNINTAHTIQQLSLSLSPWTGRPQVFLLLALYLEILCALFTVFLLPGRLTNSKHFLFSSEQLPIWRFFNQYLFPFTSILRDNLKV